MSTTNRTDPVRAALFAVWQTLDGERWDHEGDEDSGQCDEGCDACKWEALREQARLALETGTDSAGGHTSRFICREYRQSAERAEPSESIDEIIAAMRQHSYFDGYADEVAALAARLAEAMNWLRMLMPECQDFHHEKADRHTSHECPVLARFQQFMAADSASLTQESKE